MRSALSLLFALLVAAPATAQPAADTSVVLNGVLHYYRVAGSGETGAPPVVFLHGGPGYNSYSFAAQAGPLLEPHLPMVYFDQRGCGRSERPADGAYSMELLVADVEALRQHLGAEQIVPMGHSFGGALALEYAARYPQHVAKVVLVGPLSDSPGSQASWRAALRRWHPHLAAEADSTGDLWRAIGAAGGQAFFNRMQFRDDVLRARQDEIDAASGLANTGELSGALWHQGLGEYRFGQAERLTMPVLIVGGVDDYAIGPATMAALADGLPQATLSLYEASAHFPYVEEPARFQADVTAFLR